jgi:hypothetical protein
MDGEGENHQSYCQGRFSLLVLLGYGATPLLSRKSGPGWRAEDCDQGFNLRKIDTSGVDWKCSRSYSLKDFKMPSFCLLPPLNIITGTSYLNRISYQIYTFTINHPKLDKLLGPQQLLHFTVDSVFRTIPLVLCNGKDPSELVSPSPIRSNSVRPSHPQTCC